MRFLLPILLFCQFATAQQTAVPIGTWQEHLPYGNVRDVTASANKIYAATPYSLFTVDRKDASIGRLSRINGLTETGISTIRFDEQSQKLFIAYSNSNIDVLTSGGIKNIPDLKRENIPGDKSIYHIYPSGDLCYLSTGIGIIVLDARRYETKDSWFIGSGGTRIRVNMFVRSATHFYAATQEGLKRIPANDPNPADFRSWQNLSGNNGLPAGPCMGVALVQDQLIAWQSDSLFRLTLTGWQPFFAEGPIVSIESSGNALLVCQSFVVGGAPTRVTVLDAMGNKTRVLEAHPSLSFPHKAIIAGTDTWVADLYGGLSQWRSNSVERYQPNGPQGIASGEMIVKNGVLYATAGSVNDAWNYQYNRDGIYQLANGYWTNYNQYVYPKLDSLLDFITIAIDPRDGTIWTGSYGGGLLHIKAPGNLEIFKQNSPLQPAIGDPTSYRVSGLAFDQGGNLWVSNYGAPEFLHVKKASGAWQSFNVPFALNENGISQIVIDGFDQKWIAGPKGNGVIAFNHGTSLESTADDRWRIFRSSAGYGNLPGGDVLCLAVDKSDFIWVGTSDGIGVIQCGDGAFSQSCEAVLPIVQGGNFANYLFKGEQVRGIAVDGADRKWIATRNGAWLISPDGDKLLAHFTETNSPLLSNDVQRVAIDGQSGTVYFATSKGICSFRGTATEGGDDLIGLKVFPNPVPPGYTGTIAISGLMNNSFIKITELNGRLVYQARAIGGQASWNGRDYTGNPVASGVYLVLVTDDTRVEKAAGKIVVTR